MKHRPAAGPEQAGDLGRMATGQSFEFRIWAELIQQSRGQLHVFLPLLDAGLDGVIHRLGDGAYLPVQLKGRTHPIRGELEFVVDDAELVDDRALLIAGWLRPSGIGPQVLVVSAGEFKRLATFSPRFRVWSAAFPVHPPAGSRSHWAPHLVPLESLAARLLGPLAAAPALPFEEAEPVAGRGRERLGFLGEQEVIRRLAAESSLDLFRPFPDLETVEVLVRSTVSAHFLGLQVKTAAWTGAPAYAHVEGQIHTFHPAATTYVVALTWLPDGGRLHEECLLLPSERVPELASRAGKLWHITYRPGSSRRTQLDPYRLPLASLGEAIGKLAAS